jgi:hypothetical protein
MMPMLILNVRPEEIYKLPKAKQIPKPEPEIDPPPTPIAEPEIDPASTPEPEPQTIAKVKSIKICAEQPQKPIRHKVCNLITKYNGCRSRIINLKSIASTYTKTNSHRFNPAWSGIYRVLIIIIRY